MGKLKPEVNCMVCQQEDAGFMIRCDACDQWYHGRCVRVNKSEGERLAEWYCRFCAGWQKRHDELKRKLSALEYRFDHLQNSPTSNEAQEKYEQVYKEKDEIERQCSAQKKQLEEKNENLQTQLKESEEKVSALEKQCESLQEKDEIERQCSAQKKQLEEKNENLHTQKESEEKVSALEKQCESLQEKYHRLHSNYSQVVKEKDKLHSQLVAINKRRRLSLHSSQEPIM